MDESFTSACSSHRFMNSSCSTSCSQSDQDDAEDERSNKSILLEEEGFQKVIGQGSPEEDSINSFSPEGKQIDTIEMLLAFEEQLDMDPDRQKRLVKVLSTMERANDLPKLVRCLMRALLTNNLMSKFSSTGQKGKLAFKNRITCALIVRVVMKTSRGQRKKADILFEIAEVKECSQSAVGCQLCEEAECKGFIRWKEWGRSRQRVDEMVTARLPEEYPFSTCMYN